MFLNNAVLLLSPLLSDERIAENHALVYGRGGQYGIIIAGREARRWQLIDDGNVEVTVAPNRQNKALDTEIRLWDVSKNISGTFQKGHVLPLPT
jgi:hypothetical protein